MPFLNWAAGISSLNATYHRQLVERLLLFQIPSQVHINKYFSFRKIQAIGVYSTFFDKKAQCTDAAYFAQFMLKRAGYKTFIRSVKWDEDPWDGLHTGAGIILEDRRYLLVSNYTGINSISGPFTSLEGLDQKLSCGRKIIDSKWGAYYPPRYY